MKSTIYIIISTPINIHIVNYYCYYYDYN